MIKIDDRLIVTTDWHFGLALNSVSKLNILVKVVRRIVADAKAGKIRHVLFLGDMFHNRNTLDLRVLNVAIKCVDLLTSYCKLYLVVGNHDTYNKTSNEVNSVNVFRNNRNVTIIEKPEVAEICGKKCLLAPWLTDFSQYRDGEFDMMAGHFDIDQKYLVESYAIMHSEAIGGPVPTASDKRRVNSNIGEFVMKAKPGGTVLAGHIHTRKEFTVKRRKFVFVGSPYQQNLGEAGGSCGYYVMDRDSLEFVEISDTPRHVDVRMSDVLKEGIDKFDFSRYSGQIVRKVYDVEVDRVLDGKITQKVQDVMPYEELTPDYDVQVSYEDASGKTINESVDLIRKSKLEYMKSYIAGMDKGLLEKEEIEPDRLYRIMESYYDRVSEGK